MPPLDMIRDLLLNAVLPAFGVALMLFVVTRRAPGTGGLAAALAVLVAVAEANSLNGSLPWLPTVSGWTMTLWVTALATLAQAVVALVPPTWGVLVRLLASRLIAWVLVPAGWPVAIVTLTLFAGWVLLEDCLRELPTGLGPALLAVLLGGGAATVLIHAHSARFTEAVMILSSALLGVAAGALVYRDDGRGIVGPTLAYLNSLLHAGWTGTYSEVPATSFFLIALAPLGLSLLYFPYLRDAVGWRRGLLVGGLLLIPVSIAVYLAMSHESVRFE